MSQEADEETWLDITMSAIASLWPWWVGLFDSYAWREIGAYLVPGIFLLGIVMFWGIRQMHRDH